MVDVVTIQLTYEQLDLLQKAISDAMVYARRQKREEDAAAFNGLEDLIITLTETPDYRRWLRSTKGW